MSLYAIVLRLGVVGVLTMQVRFFFCFFGRAKVVAPSLPECLLPIGNREVLDIQLEALEKCGVTEVTLLCPLAVLEPIR